ncbi:MAG: anthranilate phosphoribosyltransferase [Candidatus Marinimicrobia bacterium]|nr:anthranilate phosphoribosyltransferase [Candidatus Neomarinimicrobiota bacterium]
MTDFKTYLRKITDGAGLSETEAEAAFESLMSGTATPTQASAFLMGLSVRGETIAELTGAARIMRAKALKVDAPPGAIDTCGTGGDGAGTFNISTAVAIVTAACGVPVAKHGNRAMSSKSGTADVLAALGVNLDATPEMTENALRNANIGFLFAQRHHSAAKYVAPVRQELGIRTIFNLVGPLSNPAGANRQLLGVFAQKWIVPMVETLARLGSERAWVVHGCDGLDEITTTGPTFVAELNMNSINTFEIVPEDAGLKRAKLDDLKGGDIKTNASALKSLLHGRSGPYQDIVVLNVGAALVIADKVSSIREGAEMALNAIMSGKAAQTLESLVAISHGRKP